MASSRTATTRVTVSRRLRAAAARYGQQQPNGYDQGYGQQQQPGYGQQQPGYGQEQQYEPTQRYSPDQYGQQQNGYDEQSRRADRRLDWLDD